MTAYPLLIEAVGDDQNPSAPLGQRYRSHRADWWRDTNPRQFVRPPWVARLHLDPAYGLAREYLDSMRDYADANSIGSRGIWLTYWLQDGVYEVFCHLNWKQTDHYFCVVRSGALERITEAEVMPWLNALSASTS